MIDSHLRPARRAARPSTIEWLDVLSNSPATLTRPRLGQSTNLEAPPLEAVTGPPHRPTSAKAASSIPGPF
ncbi:hypothetical protein NITHO_1300002 [Nitrolancea hollandica Lb]|uniref:Uncharacterized protein n=1 Tax=Nitrolancea hollandica Lb TaxID=1129897 RepID=I4ED05_9BACT|nr:hypothetical protein NITHO_1300002 [Nitrolancea hollandica Lb]